MAFTSRDLWGTGDYHPQEEHNRGQSDASEGKYDPPVRTPLDALSDGISGSNEDYEEAREAYEQGHDHGSSQKSGCFITTACVRSRNLEDDCDLLSRARAFRDGYLAGLPGGPAMISEYYAIAPAIVQAVNASASAEAEWQRVYGEVERALLHAEVGEPRVALESYRVIVSRLRAAYL